VGDVVAVHMDWAQAHWFDEHGRVVASATA